MCCESEACVNKSWFEGFGLTQEIQVCRGLIGVTYRCIILNSKGELGCNSEALLSGVLDKIRRLVFLESLYLFLGLKTGMVLPSLSMKASSTGISM